MSLPALRDILEEYELVEAEDRYRLLIDLGQQLEPMPDALKTEATKVRGCAASVWLYPTEDEGRLIFSRRQRRCNHQGHSRAGADRGAVQARGRNRRHGHRRRTGPVRAWQAPQRQSHARGAEHDRADQEHRRALRRSLVLVGAAGLSQREPALLGLAQHVIGRLDLLEALRRFGVARLQVGMIVLGELAIGRLDRLEIGISYRASRHRQRAHLLAAPAAVARDRPTPSAATG